MRLLALFLLLNIGTIPFFASAHGEETHLEVLPSSLAYEAGEEFSVAIVLSAGEPVTAFRIHLAYDSATLGVKEITTDDEHFPFWFKQEESGGLIELEAAAPMPGFNGEAGVATVVFRALESGASEVFVQDTSLVLNAQDDNLLLSPAATSEQTPLAPQNGAAGLILGGLVGVAFIGGVAWFLLRK